VPADAGARESHRQRSRLGRRVARYTRCDRRARFVPDARRRDHWLNRSPPADRDMRMPTRTPTLVAVGPWEDAEFAALRAELDPQRQWTTVATLVELAAALADVAAENAAATNPSVSLPPELVLLAQSRPGVDDPSQLERLSAIAPLTRV